MSKYDIYLLENSKALKNKLGINNEAALDQAESIIANTKTAVVIRQKEYTRFIKQLYT